MIRPPVGVACSEQLKSVVEFNVDGGRTKTLRRPEVESIVGRIAGLRFQVSRSFIEGSDSYFQSPSLSRGPNHFVFGNFFIWPSLK